MRDIMLKKGRFKLSTTQVILLSFAFTIFIGSLLLALPFSTKSGVSVPYIDALFTATSATCVTGLVTFPTVSTWSVFGQIVILILIQLGGLGVITVMTGFMLAMNKKLGLRDSQLLCDAFNLNSLSGLSGFVKKVIVGTLIVEGVGALLYMTVFVPEFGAKGIWISVFNSVSAFCNAGIDIVAENSLCNYVKNPMINAVTCILIILGGIGYIVWWDVLRVARSFKSRGFKCARSLTLHSKIALTSTALLIICGAALIFAFEYNNPDTMKDFSLYEKIQASFFQSVTTRTAGFATLAQEDLTGASAVLCLLLMFIGGSPVGTAGGVKTVTFVILAATAYSVISNKNEVSLFNRNLSNQIVRKAVAVVSMSFMITFFSALLLSAVNPAPMLDILYETFSATATVGLSRNLTSFLNDAGKIIITLAMYFGRVGPISLAIVFNFRKEIMNNIKNPVEDVRIG